ncbi:MAG: hypothetical protein ACREQI_00880 [Candidatus Binataceae bacterium]
MTAPPFKLRLITEAQQQLSELARDTEQQIRLKAVRKALGQLEKFGPRYPALQTHPFESQQGPGGAKVFVAYAEQGTPAAYRILWCYGPAEGELTILWIGPHY